MVYRKFALREWAKPNFMIFLAWSVETTAIFTEDFFDSGGIVRHQAATGSVVLSSP